MLFNANSSLLVLAAHSLTNNIFGSFHRHRSVAYVNPAINGGSMLNHDVHGLGEPLNVIISGLSDPAVLTDQGFVNYARAIGFTPECLGIHLGAPQSANLGDGNGFVNQTIELRQDFGLGGCIETLVGGNHFRVYRQNGPLANTSALFLAVSEEMSVSEHHTISPDGYDLGRDLLVSQAIGKNSFEGVTYCTVARNLTGLLPIGSAGVNHGIGIDGIVKLLTVHIE